MTERGESEFSLSLSNYSHDDNMKQFSLPQMNQTKVSLDKLIDPTLLKIEVFMMSVAFTLSLIGNLIVIITLLVRHFIKPKKLTKTQTNKSFYSSNQANSNNAANNNNGNVSQFKTRKFTRMNFYILNLSIADVYVSLGNILTMLLWRRNNNLFYGDDLACRLVAYFQLVSVYYSTYVLMTMTLDRYEAICKPLFSLSWSKARGFAYIFGAFVVSHLQGIPQLMFFALRELKDVEPSVVTCLAEFSPPWLQNVYIIYTWFMQFLIPLCVIIVCYASISVKVFSNRNDMARSTIKYTSKLAKNDPSARKTLLASSSSQGNEHQLHSPVDGTETPRSKKDNVLSFRQHGRKNFSKSKIKTIKLTLTVIILYVICSTPYFVGMIIHLMSSAMKLGTAISNFFFCYCYLLYTRQNLIVKLKFEFSYKKNILWC